VEHEMREGVRAHLIKQKGGGRSACKVR
jgi:hypothetical protein